MANVSDSFTVQAPLETVWQACEGAVVAIGWTVASKSSNIHLVCKEPMGTYLLYAMPVAIEINLTRVSPQATQINLKGSNFGLGPIAANHIKGHMNTIRGRIASLAAAPQGVGS